MPVDPAHGDKSEKPLPPGSFGLPLLGETLDYVRDPHRFFEDRVRRHGPVFKTHILGKPTAVLAGPEAFSFFVTQPHFARREANPRPVRELLGDCLPFQDGSEHGRRKSIVLAALGAETIDRLLSILQEEARAAIRRWSRQSETVLLPELKRLAAEVCVQWFFGREGHSEAEELEGTLDAFVIGLTAFPLPVSHTRYGRALRARDRLRALLHDAAAQRQGGSPGPLLEAVLASRAADESRLQGSVSRDEVLHLLFAAYTGLYDALLLLVWDLARNPEARDRAAAEARRELPRSGPLDHRDLAKLTYLDALCREVRRNNRINPATFFATVTSSIEVAGYHVPAGWRAVAGIYTTMHLDGVFTHPERFEPERFLPGRAEHQRHDNSYVPHGGGPAEGHRCAGEDLISAVLMTTGAMLLRGDHSWEVVEGQDLRLNREVFPLPRSGLRVRFRREEEEAGH